MSEKSFAILFPGQGSQSIGMLKELASEFSVVPKIFEKASTILNYDLWELTQNFAEKLNQTEFTQPALLTAEYAMWECWKQSHGEHPKFLAGHSLGEYTAFVCADSLEFTDGLRLVSERGRLMQQAVSEGEGAMAAIVGLNNETILTLCEEAKRSHEVLSPANYNSIGQVVIAGHYHSVIQAIDLAKQKGAKLAKLIPVSVPSHCALMQKAADQLSLKLKQIEFKKPKIPVIQNFDVTIHFEPDDIRKSLIKQLVNPVRWVEIIQYLEKQNIAATVECGPGKVISGLNKRISEKLINYNFHNAETLKEVIQEIRK